MSKVNFIKRDDFRKSKHDKTSPKVSFSLTSDDEGMIRQLIKRLELEDEYIWIKA